jgi:hypothetical protein
MKTKVSVLAVVSLLIAQSLSASVTHSIGIARNSSDATIQYIEHHQYLSSGDHLITYYDSKGAILATKVLTYSGLPQHPEIIESDFTRGTNVQAYSSDTTLKMVSNASGRIKKYELPLDETTIVDAGFDNFLRSNWQRFKTGESRTFKFAIVGQGRLLKVNVTKEFETPGTTAFTIKPRNFFIRLLVPEMRLVYSADRRLAGYEGLTNLNLPSRDVSIEFSHYTSLTDPLSNGYPRPSEGMISGRVYGLFTRLLRTISA